MPNNNSREHNFSDLPAYQPRKFVSENINLGNVDEVTALFNRLLESRVESASQLEQFIMDRSELEAVLSQYEAVLYIRMTCQTDDKKRADDYKKFVETISPVVKQLSDKLDRKYMQAKETFALDEIRYEVYDRNIKADIELFRKENVPLQTKEELLKQEYQTICGAMTVHFQGKEHTMPQMRVYREKTDRDLRESAWRKTAERCLEDSKKLDNIFDKMLVLRGKIASNAGFDNYRDYKFMQYHRFDYTPADCRQYHDAVEKTVVPVLTEIYDDRKKQMKLDSLRPWDLDVDPQGREPLKPFDNIDEYIKGTRQVFANIRPQFAKQFQEMAELGLLDLESRKGKAPGGYQETLAEIRKPFIFGNVVGLDNDLRLIFHEGGHAFHALASADEPVYTYRHAPIEFCEVASQAMELFAVEHLKVFYNEQDAKRSIRKHFEEILMLLSWIATIDAFQHWIYENPNHTANERCEKWLQIHNRFGSKLIDFSGLETERKYLWHRQLHIFEVPFYYIEYGISLLGALGLWLQSKKDMNGALDNYLKALSLGGSRPLPELFAAAGLEFDFSQRTIAPLVNAVREQLNQLQ